MATAMTRNDILKNTALQMAIDHHRADASRTGVDMNPPKAAQVIATAKEFLSFLTGK